MYRGGIVQGTKEAIRAELDEIFMKIRGKEGEEVRNCMGRLHDVVVTSRKEGQSAKSMSYLGSV